MEKKVELTINKKIFLNLFISFILAVLTVFILNLLEISRSEYNSCWNTVFGDLVCHCQDRLNCSLLALLEDSEIIVILYITAIFWTISLINHFVKFRIK